MGLCLPARTRATRVARRPRVSPSRRRRTSGARSRLARCRSCVHQSSCPVSFVIARCRSPSEDDPPEAQALRRATRRRAPAAGGQQPRHRRGLPVVPVPDCAAARRRCRRTIWRRNASARTSIVISDPSAGPGPVQGPDRLPIGRRRRRRSRAGRPAPTRLAPSPRHPAFARTPSACARGAGCAVRSRWCTGTPGSAPRSGVEPEWRPAKRGPRHPAGASRRAPRARSSAESPPG